MSNYWKFAFLRPATVVGAVGSLAMLASIGSTQVLEGNLLLRQVDGSSNGWVNQVFPDQATYSSGMGSMVAVTGFWEIGEIQVYQVNNLPNTWYGNVNQAVLNVTQQVGGAPDPAYDPTIVNAGAGVVYSGLVSVTLDQPSTDNQAFRVRANTAGIAELQGMTPGDYVFSLTPIASYADYGQTFTATAGVGPAPDYLRNPGDGFGYGADWMPISTIGAATDSQWAIGINGVVPEPSGILALAAGLALLARKRRR